MRLKGLATPSVGVDVERVALSCTAGGSVKCTTTLENGQFLKLVEHTLVYDPQVLS